jgi:hypothetical protein
MEFAYGNIRDFFMETCGMLIESLTDKKKGFKISFP